MPSPDIQHVLFNFSARSGDVFHLEVKCGSPEGVRVVESQAEAAGLQVREFVEIGFEGGARSDAAWFPGKGYDCRPIYGTLHQLGVLYDTLCQMQGMDLSPAVRVTGREEPVAAMEDLLRQHAAYLAEHGFLAYEPPAVLSVLVEASRGDAADPLFAREEWFEEPSDLKTRLLSNRSAYSVVSVNFFADENARNDFIEDYAFRCGPERFHATEEETLRGDGVDYRAHVLVTPEQLPDLLDHLQDRYGMPDRERAGFEQALAGQTRGRG